MLITDIHTHAFPDALAERAMRKLMEEIEGDSVKAWLDGRSSSLVASMDKAGIRRSVICSIATKPEQFEPILKWSTHVRSDRLLPLPSVHPRDPDALPRLDRIHREGFPGIKLHPYYQDFFLDEDALLPIYRKLADLGMILICHTGFDIAFPRTRRCDPQRIAWVASRFPSLKFIATHLGAWMDWEEVRRHLIGHPIYMEISYALGQIPDDECRAMLGAHSPSHLLFGTDSPWQDQTLTLQRLRVLRLDPERERAILGGNADRLLGPPTPESSMKETP